MSNLPEKSQFLIYQSDDGVEVVVAEVSADLACAFLANR